MFYPSIGNPSYPYIAWEMRRRDFVLKFLGDIATAYNRVCRSFRNEFHWTPDQCDSLKIRDIGRIYKELNEDIERKNGEYQE